MNKLTLTNFDTFSLYIKEIKKIPRLSKDEEYSLLLDYKNNNNIQSAQKIVLSNLRFVVHYAKQFKGYGLPLMDIIQEGNIGLMRALKKFDINSNVRFITFAVYRIKESIYNFIINNFSVVKVATTKEQRKLFFNLRKLKNDNSYSSTKEIECLSNKLNVSKESIVEMENRLYKGNVSFSNHDVEETNLLSDDYIQSQITESDIVQSHIENPANLIENIEFNEYQIKILKEGLCLLDKRSIDIITNRWLSNDKLTLNDLAKKYNISIERVRQLEQNAMKKLKTYMIKT